MQRIFAIGDIHGCYEPFDLLLKTINLKPDDILVTLGDYIDRGPDSRMVIERLIELSKTHNIQCLRGNHEQMMMDAREGGEPYYEWVEVGGRSTIKSYGGIDKVPALHWDFMEKQCIDCWECDTHFFVHGNVYPELALADQPLHELYWGRFYNVGAHVSGKIMVCGHTSQKNGRVRNLGYAVCIDTYVYGGQWLSCLNIGSGEIYQADIDGESRVVHLDDFIEQNTPWD